MTAATGDFGLLRVSAEALRPIDRLPFYSDLMARSVGKAHIEAIGSAFAFDTRVCRLPGLDVVYGTVSARRVSRTREVTDSGCEKLFLLMCLEGGATVAQFKKDATVLAGGALLFSAAAPVRMEWSTSRFFLLAMPRVGLEPMIANADSALMSVISCVAEPLRLLTGYLGLFVREPAIETPELRRMAVNHVHDLVALAVGATSDAAAIASARGLPAARMRSIKADIAQNLGGELTADALAARHRVSSRYVRKLFQRENASLSQFVRGLRLARAHRMLTEPRYARFTISAIAFEAGFGDVSTFNRHFRNHFGMTPSDVRALGRRT